MSLYSSFLLTGAMAIRPCRFPLLSRIIANSSKREFPGWFLSLHTFPFVIYALGLGNRIQTPNRLFDRRFYVVSGESPCLSLGGVGWRSPQELPFGGAGLGGVKLVKAEGESLSSLLRPRGEVELSRHATPAAPAVLVSSGAACPKRLGARAPSFSLPASWR